MKYFTVYDIDGNILRCGICQADSFEAQASEGEYVIEGAYDAALYYINNDEAIAKASPPSDNYNWDEATKVWVGNVAQAKLSKKKAIDAKRVELDKSNIPYGGSSFQANDESIANIQGKIQEIAAGLALNLTISPLVWLDAANVLHSWATLAEYQEWMQGLILAIASRRTTLYTNSWTHKAAIEALTTVAAIEAYDDTTGWE